MSSSSNEDSSFSETGSSDSESRVGFEEDDDSDSSSDLEDDEEEDFFLGYAALIQGDQSDDLLDAEDDDDSQEDPDFLPDQVDDDFEEDVYPEEDADDFPESSPGMVPWQPGKLVREIILAKDAISVDDVKRQIKSVYENIKTKLERKTPSRRGTKLNESDCIDILFNHSCTGLMMPFLGLDRIEELYQFFGTFCTLCYQGKSLSKLCDQDLQSIQGSPLLPMNPKRFLQVVDFVRKNHLQNLPHQINDDAIWSSDMLILREIENAINLTMTSLTYHDSCHLLLDDFKMEIFSRRSSDYGISLHGGRTTRILPVTHDLCLGYCFLLVANGLQLAGHDKASTVERILKRLQPTNPDIPSLPRDTVFADRGYNDQRRTMSVLRATHAKLMGTAKSGPKNCHSIDDSSQDEKIFVNSYGAETFYVASNTEEGYAQALYCTGKAKGKAITLWVSSPEDASRWVFVPKSKKVCI